jgi:tRNA A-37 threonylcarbamoyl transferase component Bud32
VASAAQDDDEFAGLLGRVLADRYRVDKLLGRGGMGAVFRGHQLTLKRDVAIKVLHPELTRDDQIARRFEREARSTALLEHPNIVQVLESGATEDGFRYIVMQLLNGRELDAYMGTPMPPRLAITRVLQVFKALEHAHKNGVVHRDLKPENVFVTTDDEGHEVLKLVDFGIAKLTSGDEESGEKMTKLGLVFGTPQYMSPEQATGLETDERTDLYSSGVMLYEMLAGHPPFQADDPIALIRMQVASAPPPLPADIPVPLQLFVVKLLAKQRDERFASASETRRALEGIAAELDGVAPAGSSMMSEWAATLDPASTGIVSASMPNFGSAGMSMTGVPGAPMGAVGSGVVGRLGPGSGPHGMAPTMPNVGLPGTTTVPPGREPSRALLIGIAGVGIVGLVVGLALAFGGGTATIGIGVPRGSPTGDASPAAGSADAAGGVPLPADNSLASQLQQIDKLLELDEADAARKLVDDLLATYPNDGKVLWRSAKLTAKRSSTQSKVKALETFAQALDAEPNLIEDEVFFGDLLALMRHPRVKGKATDFAIDRLGQRGHEFLVEKLNDTDPKDALSFDRRHRAIDVLSAYPERAKQINMELNLMRDLWQALGTDQPCSDYATALEGIARHPTVGLRDRLRTAKVPSKPGPKETAGMCESLDGWRHGLVVSLTLRFPTAGPSEIAAAEAAYAANPSATGGDDEIILDDETAEPAASTTSTTPSAPKKKKKKKNFFERVFKK